MSLALNRIKTYLCNSMRDGLVITDNLVSIEKKITYQLIEREVVRTEQY